MRFLAALPMRMPTISMATPAMITVDIPASRANVRLLCSLRVAAGPAVAVLIGALPSVGRYPGLCEGGDEDRLDRVQAVLGLVEHDAGRRVEYLTGDFEAGGHAGVLHDLPADGGVRVVERGQAVHELGRGVPGGAHQGGVDLVGGEHPDPVRPDILGLAHGHPHVGVDEVDTGNGLAHVVGDGDARAGAAGDVGGDVGDVLGRVQLLRAGEADVAAH